MARRCRRGPSIGCSCCPEPLQFDLCTAILALPVQVAAPVGAMFPYIGVDGICGRTVIAGLTPFDLCAALLLRPLGVPGVPGVTEFIGSDCSRHLLPSAAVPFNLCTGLAALTAGAQGVANVDSYVGPDCLTHLLPVVPPAFSLCPAIAGLAVGAQGVAGITQFVGADCQLHALPAAGAFDLCAAIAALPVGTTGVFGATQFVGIDCQLHLLPIPTAETPLVATDTATIDFTTSGIAGHSLTGGVKVSANAGNTVTAVADGIYVPSFCIQLALIPVGAQGVAGVDSYIGTDCQSHLLPAAGGGGAGAQNGLNQTVAPGFNELGGTLLHGTTINQQAFQLALNSLSGTASANMVHAPGVWSEVVADSGPPSVEGKFSLSPILVTARFSNFTSGLISALSLNNVQTELSQSVAGGFTGKVSITAAASEISYLNPSGILTRVALFPTAARMEYFDPVTPNVNDTEITLSAGLIELLGDITSIVRLTAYPNTRNDTGVPVNVLSTDASGNLQSHPISELAGTETSLTANDSATIDFTTSGVANHTLTGSVKISADVGNAITAVADGIFALTGGTPALSAVIDPIANWTRDMNAFLVSLTWDGNFGAASAFRLHSTDTNATGPVFHISTAVTALTPPLLVEPRGAQRLLVSPLGNVVLGQGGIGGGDVDGHVYLPVVGSNAFPSSVPTVHAGFAPIEAYSNGIQGEFGAAIYVNGVWRDLSGWRNRYVALSGTGAQNIDFDAATSENVTRQYTFTGNSTFTFLNPPPAGSLITLVLVQGGAGGFTATWPGTVKWAGGVAPVPGVTAQRDIVQFVWDGSNYWETSRTIAAV